MSRTYKATGINLKSSPLGEADRVLTILTREHGLVRAVAMGARKHNSRLAGRSGLFVVNQLLIARGRSLDKVTQAETVESYPGLARDLKKLTVGQYIAELCLFQALSDQPQEALFVLLNRYLKQLERSPSELVLPLLTLTLFQLLMLEGVTPEVQVCCATRQPLVPQWDDPQWRVGFSLPAGGTVTLEVLEELQQRQLPHYRTLNRAIATTKRQKGQLYFPLAAAELALLQAIAQAAQASQADPETLPLAQLVDLSASLQCWLSIEQLLRAYAQYQFDRLIQSATLIERCFLDAHPN